MQVHQDGQKMLTAQNKHPNSTKNGRVLSMIIQKSQY